MTSTLTFDADLAQRVEAVYATPDVAATRVAVSKAAAPRSAETALDIGCGPGYLSRQLALAVGAEGKVIAVDASEAMLGLAGQRWAGLDQVRLEKGDALKLPAADASVDFACVLQAFCYIKELDQALAELRRVLRPGGRAVILDTDFSGVVWESRNRERMQKVLRAYDGHVAWPDLPRVLPRRLHRAGFEVTRCEALSFLTLRYHPNTYVFGIAHFVHQYVIKNARFPADEADAWLAEFDALEQDNAFFFSMDRYMFVVRGA